jgi:hypothetical protein
MASISQYRKSITALVTAVLGWSAVVVASAPTAITSTEWQLLAVGVAAALGVLAVPNAGTTVFVPVVKPEDQA